jgi:hypothetical protein
MKLVDLSASKPVHSTYLWTGLKKPLTSYLVSRGCRQLLQRACRSKWATKQEFAYTLVILSNSSKVCEDLIKMVFWPRLLCLRLQLQLMSMGHNVIFVSCVDKCPPALYYSCTLYFSARSSETPNDCATVQRPKAGFVAIRTFWLRHPHPNLRPKPRFWDPDIKAIYPQSFKDIVTTFDNISHVVVCILT